VNNKDSHIRQLLKRWITGDITLSDERRLNETAKKDDFLAEALAGLRSTTETDHEQNITQLRKQLKLKNNTSKYAYLSPLRIAAAIALLVTAGWLVWNAPGIETANDMAMNKEATPNSIEKEVAPIQADTEVLTTEEVAIEEEPVAATKTETVKKQEPFTDKKEQIAQASPPSSSIGETYSNTTAQAVEKVEAITETAASTSKDQADEVLSNETVVLTEDAPTVLKQSPIVYENDADIQEEEYSRAAASQVSPSMISNSGIPTPAAGYRIIEGRVTDSEGYPLIGVSIYQENTSNGVISDIDGYFTLAVSEGDNKQLNCSYVGFETRIIPLGSQTQYTIVLNENLMALDEVVVTGYDKRRQPRSQENNSSIPPQEIAPFGGFDTFKDYIRQNTPDGVGRGKIRLRFLISSDGRPNNITIIRSTNPSLNDLAIGLLATGPNWLSPNTSETQEVEYLMRIR